MSASDLYSEHADSIESVLTYIRRANRLSADAGDEFCASARLRLLEDDCAILRKFRGQSSFKTYLVVVLQRQFLDWRAAEWGRPRPPVGVRRLGPIAIELWRQVIRDGLDYDQAVRTTIAKQIAMSEAECDAIWRQIKKRARRSFVDIENVDLPDAAQHDPVAGEQQRARAAAVRTALRAAVAALPFDDQLILRMRHDGVSVAQIAKLQGLDQKALYRRFEQIYSRLRKAMIGAGILLEDVREFIGSLDHDDDDDDDDDDDGNEGGGGGDSGPVGGNNGVGPSILPNAGGAA